MNIPAVSCEHCGSRNVRRARIKTVYEALRICMGVYPFRCHDCRTRFPLSVWLFSKMQYAKCPRCLGLDLTSWSRKHYNPGLWKRTLINFGARSYRCPNCRCNFVSFLPRKWEPKADKSPEVVEDGETGKAVS